MKIKLEMQKDYIRMISDDQPSIIDELLETKLGDTNGFN